MAFMSYDHSGVKGHVGDHRGQKVKFLKNVSTLLNYIALTRDLYICYSLTLSTKVMGIENHQGSFGVTGVKRSFSLKML